MEGDYDDTPTTISSFNQNELRNLLIMICSSIMIECLHQSLMYFFYFIFFLSTIYKYL